MKFALQLRVPMLRLLSAGKVLAEALPMAPRAGAPIN